MLWLARALAAAAVAAATNEWRPADEVAVAEGTVYVVGKNDMGQLTLEDPVVGRPTVVLTGVQAVGRSSGFSVLLTSGGAARSVGDNAFGQLGDGSTESKGSLVTVIDDGVRAVSTGSGYSAFLLADGGVLTVGNNQLGQLGDGTTTTRSTPQSALIEDVSAISAGQWHLVFLRYDGTAWATGWNTLINAGALGDGTNDAGVSSDRAMPVQVQSVTAVQAISAGKSHTLFLRANGDVWGTGQNWQGELGLNNNDSPLYSPVRNTYVDGVQAIEAGEGCSFFVKASGEAWASGSNANGRLGDGTTQDRYSPVLVLSGVQSVSSLNEHTLFLKADGLVYASGGNAYGQLGTGRYGDEYEPVKVAVDHVISAVAGEYHSFFLASSDANTELPCTAGTSVFVSGLSIDLEMWLAHQGQRSLRCPEGFLGSVEVECWNGELSVTEDHCSMSTAAPTPAPTPAPTAVSCEPGTVATGAPANMEGVEAVLPAPLPHLGQAIVPCSEGYIGAAILECSEGAVAVVDNLCEVIPAGVPTPAPLLGCGPGESASAEGAEVVLASPLAHLGMRVVACSDGYVGAAVVECSEGAIFFVENSCVAAPSPAPTAAPTPSPTAAGCEPGEVSTSVGVDVSVASALPHRGVIIALCPSGYVGTAVVECSEGALTVLQSSCAVASTPAPTSAPTPAPTGASCESGAAASTEGAEAVLTAPLPHHGLKIVPCSEGYAGAAVVHCSEGVLEFVASTCVEVVTPAPAPSEPPTPAPTSTSCAPVDLTSEAGLVTPLLERGLTIVSCAEGYVGAAVVECLAGDVRIVQNNCVANPTLAPTGVPTPAPTAVDCEPGETAIAEGAEVNLTEPLPHQGLAVVSCSDGYRGAVVVGCSQGALEVVQNTCVAAPTRTPTVAPSPAPTAASCEPGEVTVAEGADVNLTSPLPHQEMRVVPCFSGYVGAAVVECWEGTLKLVENSCAAGCASGQVAAVAGDEVVLTAPLPEHGRSSLACPAGSLGTVVVECSEGALRVVDSSSCSALSASPAPTAAGCAPGPVLGLQAGEVVLPVELPPGGQRSVACPRGLVGAAVVACTGGGLGVVRHDCAVAPWVTTITLEPAASGATIVVVASEAGLAVGDQIRISSSGRSEVRTIAGFGSIILDSPLTYAHPQGATVEKLPDTEGGPEVTGHLAGAETIIVTLATALALAVCCCVAVTACWQRERRLRAPCREEAAGLRELREEAETAAPEPGAKLMSPCSGEGRADQAGGLRAERRLLGEPPAARGRTLLELQASSPKSCSKISDHLSCLDAFPGLAEERLTHPSLGTVPTYFPEGSVSYL